MRAYLVGHLDVTKTPPTVTEVGVYSESASHLTADWDKAFPFDITFAEGDDFEEAYRNLAMWVRSHKPIFNWITPLLKNCGAGLRVDSGFFE